MFFYVRRLVRTEEDAWDVLQETWLKVFRSLGSLKDPEALSVWLYRVARNTAVSHGRARDLSARRLEDDAVPADREAEDGGTRFEDAEQVHYGLSRISPAHREALTLFFLEDLSVGEIAEVVGVSAGTIKSRLHHAKRALRDVLRTQEH